MAKNPKMVICRNCNAPISKKAAVCPSCGVKNKVPFYRRGWFIFIVVIFVIVIAACYIGDNPKNKEEEEVSLEVSEDKHNDTLEIEEVAQDEEAVSGEEGSASETVNGIRPEFKEMLDGYEAFCDEYIEFMKRYKSSGNTVDMLAEYTDYAAKYADIMNKLNELNGSEMSAEEAAYCAEVTARINQKLVEVAVP